MLTSLFVALAGAAIVAQSNAPEKSPSFEVASVKPVLPEGPRRPRQLFFGPSGDIVAINVTLPDLIARAYGLKPHQLAPGPEWTRRERFDVIAKPASPVPVRQGIEMLKALLADRFNVRLRSDTAPRPYYALIQARDGKLGPSLAPSKHDCAAFFARGGDPLSADAPHDERKRPVCGEGGLIGAVTMVSFGGATMSEIAAKLGAYVDRIVVDETGLAGTYDVSLLMFTTDPQATRGVTAPGSSQGPDLFEAVQSQLGLKLERRTGPVEIFVIESIDRPTPN